MMECVCLCIVEGLELRYLELVLGKSCQSQPRFVLVSRRDPQLKLCEKMEFDLSQEYCLSENLIEPHIFISSRPPTSIILRNHSARNAALGLSLSPTPPFRIHFLLSGLCIVDL